MHHNRVYVVPSPAKKGEKVEIKYQGILQNSGADSVWCHYGYDGWNQSSTVHMQKDMDNAFKCHIPANGQKEINLCFKDSANNWDNNDGWNWNCEISGRGLLF